MRFSKSLGGFLTETGAAGFLAGFCFLTGLEDFLAGTFLAAFGAPLVCFVADFLPAGFLVRVRA